MKKRTAGRVSAMAMASAMIVSVAAVNVGAAPIIGDGETDITSVPVGKTVTTDGYSYAPSTTFTFHVETGAAQDDFEGNVVYAGVAGGLTAGTGATFSSDGVTLEESYTGTGSLNVDSSKFAEPGVYHYVVTENQTPAHPGVTYSQESYDVYVYVYADEDETNLYAGHVVSVKDGDKADLEFTNDYKTKLHDLTITKTVTGNQKNYNKEFSFTVTIDGDADGEYFYMTVDGKKYATLTEGVSKTFTLKHGQSAKIYGLSEDDTYTVTEADYKSSGYKTTITGADTTETAGNGQVLTAKGDVADGDDNVVFENNKNATSPTGIARAYTPYALVMAAASALGVLFFRKKREE